ncbi:MAG TPA: hypothetical protein VNO70_18440 [Blastocatellia bacterium]|nr:hypothetical protein [Blastocatellia bacterium]
MYRSKIVCTVIAVLLFAFMTPPAWSQAAKESQKQDKPFDLIEFINHFQIGMTYSQVQATLPKEAEQEAMSYDMTDEVFVLNVDGPERENWGASFKFDTLDEPLRRPEQLVEIVFSTLLSSRDDSFDELVRKANQIFGKPVEVDNSQERFQKAGWRISGGSILKLEYSVLPDGAIGKDVNVDFILMKGRRRTSSAPASVA